jgi:serine/threonine-protein kinase RsbW
MTWKVPARLWNSLKRSRLSLESSSSIVLQAQIGELERLKHWLENLFRNARLSSRLSFRVDLCLTEIVTNVISYGYAAGQAPREAVALHYCLTPADVVFEVSDRGAAFDPTTYVPTPLPTSLEDAEVGGRGLRLVRQYVGSMRYQRDSQGNRLELRFPLETIA